MECSCPEVSKNQLMACRTCSEKYRCSFGQHLIRAGDQVVEIVNTNKDGTRIDAIVRDK